MTFAPDLLTPLHAPDGVPTEVAELFEKLALELHGAGFNRYSADALLHRIRWHFHVEQKNREFKINDHYSAGLARWFLARHPEMHGFFELRALRSGEAA